ncbi:response regulator [Thiomicrospira microaerophila]|uniref:response regulator n=1 Tax=Thiomicrospira microaerophila TaxID=406020 RepID=UPI0005C944B8|nr:response regulator [Thiomicrospira microaerophila]
MRVLAVDDSVSIRELVRLVLQATEGVSLVETADSVDQALSIIQSQPFDLFIIDWYMQPKSGAILLKEIKAQTQFNHIPVIVLSADQDPQAKALAKRLGAIGWMTKPFNPKRLQELVLSYKVG